MAINPRVRGGMTSMTKVYVTAGEQLVPEIYVRDLSSSIEFLRGFGFELVRIEHDFAELRWDECLLFLEQIDDYPDPPLRPVANIRVMVPDVDEYWRKAQERGVPVIRAIDDRYYGLRDFTIGGPDGIALRFASGLPSRRKE